MKETLAVFIVSCLSILVFAQAAPEEIPFSLTISTPKTEYSCGEPVCVTVTLRNASKVPVKFERPKAEVPHGNFCVSARSGEGTPSGLGSGAPFEAVYSEIKDQQNDGTCTLLPGGIYKASRCGLLDVCGHSSTWEIWAEYQGRGRFVTVQIEGVEPKKWNCEQCWKGTVQSNRITIHFSQPAGPDLEPYERVIKPQYCPEWKGGSHDWFLGALLASKYPDSLYATWERFVALQTWVQDTYKGPYINNPYAVKCLPYRRGVYSPQSRDELARQEDQRAPYLIEQSKLILRNHPNLEPVASVTRVDLAALLYITGDTPGAKEQLEAVIKACPDCDEGKAAKQMLDVILASPTGAGSGGGK